MAAKEIPDITHKSLSSLLEFLRGPFRNTPKGHQNTTYCSIELVLSGAIFYVLTRGVSIGMLFFFNFFFNFFYVYLFLRQRESMNGGGSESKGDTESETGSRL